MELVQYCAKVMQTKFVEIRPLFLRLLYEVIEFSKDVSKGSKRKNHHIPRKFERVKFEVATFRGNQTKKHDTKFEAANCFMTRTAANDIADQALVNKLNSYRK